LVPFALVPEVAKVTTVWLAVPLSVVVTWVFTTLEKVGDATANPFEGSANDVPITAMSRGIEIDLRQLFGEPDVPPPLQPHNDILT
jgi:putative membrane protein